MPSVMEVLKSRTILFSSLNCCSVIEEEDPPPKIITPSSDSDEVKSEASVSSVELELNTSSIAAN